MAPQTKLNLPPPFEEAVKSLEREIMRFLLRSTRDRDDAMDLFQETWLRAYRAYPKLSSREGLRPWIYRIATNLCRNRARDQARKSRTIVDSGRDAAELAALGAGTNHSGPDSLIHLKLAVAQLPRMQGRALAMRKFDGLEYDEIAAKLKCSPESARASVYQALKKIRASE
jgi:RNA polymerase sigma-70 factor, ECF subfamily